MGFNVDIPGMPGHPNIRDFVAAAAPLIDNSEPGAIGTALAVAPHNAMVKLGSPPAPVYGHAFSAVGCKSNPADSGCFLPHFGFDALHGATADADFPRRFKDALAAGERVADRSLGLRVNAGAADRLSALGSLRPGSGDPGMDAFGDDCALEFRE